MKGKKAKAKMPTRLRKVWATISKVDGLANAAYSRTPCIFGTRESARFNRDSDERVIQIEYRIVKVES